MKSNAAQRSRTPSATLCALAPDSSPAPPALHGTAALLMLLLEAALVAGMLLLEVPAALATGVAVLTVGACWRSGRGRMPGLLPWQQAAAWGVIALLNGLAVAMLMLIGAWPVWAVWLLARAAVGQGWTAPWRRFLAHASHESGSG